MEQRDVIHTAAQTIERNRYAWAALALVAALAALVGMTEPTAPSLITPGHQVTADELRQELAQLNAEHAAAAADLLAQAEALEAKHAADTMAADISGEIIARKHATRRAVVELVGGAAIKAATGQPLGALELLISAASGGGLVIAGGVAMDNRRKDKRIKAKAEQAEAIARENTFLQAELDKLRQPGQT